MQIFKKIEEKCVSSCNKMKSKGLIKKWQLQCQQIQGDPIFGPKITEP